MEKQLTAIDLLIDWLKENDEIVPYNPKLMGFINNILKHYEKQQIIDAGNSCAFQKHLLDDKLNKMNDEELIEYLKTDDNTTFGEQYYNNNFKQ